MFQNWQKICVSSIWVIVMKWSTFEDRIFVLRIWLKVQNGQNMQIFILCSNWVIFIWQFDKHLICIAQYDVPEQNRKKHENTNKYRKCSHCFLNMFQIVSTCPQFLLIFFYWLSKIVPVVLLKYYSRTIFIYYYRSLFKKSAQCCTTNTVRIIRKERFSLLKSYSQEQNNRNERKIVILTSCIFNHWCLLLKSSNF